MRNSRNGLQLRLGNIAKDEKGFDDLDEFWDAPGKWSACYVVRCHSNEVDKISFVYRTSVV